MTTVERFVEWLRKEGYEVVDHDDCWTLWPKGEPTEPGYRTVEIEKDTDEEQPDLLVWCLLRLGGQLNYLYPQVDGWAVSVGDDSVVYAAPAMTLAAMRALTGEE